jgi:hypothetical protein
MVTEVIAVAAAAAIADHFGVYSSIPVGKWSDVNCDTCR